MPKRKAVGQAARGESTLPPAPEGLKSEPPPAPGGPLEAPATNGTCPRKKRKTKTEADDAQDEGRQSNEGHEGEMETAALAARSVGTQLCIGAHVSSAGGVQNAVHHSLRIGANAFALFLKSQRKWASAGLADEQCRGFQDACKQHAYDAGTQVVPHGSYLVNLAHTDRARSDQAFASHLDDLQRCERLGIRLYNIHPGNNQCGDRQAAIAHLAQNINRAHAATQRVVILLENMAHGGNVLGSTFDDLRDIIALTTDKERVGVCIDTCHAFAAGYDLRSPAAFQATFAHLDETVGLQYLRAVHVNDSKAPFASHRDLHANIGTGFLGLRAFHSLVNDPRFHGMPLILETPIQVRDDDGHLVHDAKGKAKEDPAIWAREIKLLESLVGMDPESDEYRALETQLARRGEPERQKLMEQHDRKKDKAEKATAERAKKQREKKGGKGQQRL